MWDDFTERMSLDVSQTILSECRVLSLECGVNECFH